MDWTMPEWMEEFRRYLPEPDRVEEMMNSSATTFENAPLALMAVQTKGAVETLCRLHKAGRLGLEAIPFPPDSMGELLDDLAKMLAKRVSGEDREVADLLDRYVGEVTRELCPDQVWQAMSRASGS